MSDTALRLADELEATWKDDPAAAELRRLHELVTEDSILQRRQRDEIAQLGQALARAIERNNELEAELAEQARLNGMGSEREARLMALNAELVEALRDGLSVSASVSVSLDRRIVRDGVKLYAQTEEWCRWASEEVEPKLRAVLAKAGESK